MLSGPGENWASRHPFLEPTGSQAVSLGCLIAFLDQPCSKSLVNLCHTLGEVTTYRHKAIEGQSSDMNPALPACKVREFYYFSSGLGVGKEYFRKRNIFRRMLKKKTTTKHQRNETWSWAWGIEDFKGVWCVRIALLSFLPRPSWVGLSPEPRTPGAAFTIPLMLFWQRSGQVQWTYFCLLPLDLHIWHVNHLFWKSSSSMFLVHLTCFFSPLLWSFLPSLLGWFSNSYP